MTTLFNGAPIVNVKQRDEWLAVALDLGIFLAFDVRFELGTDGKPKAIPKPAARLFNGAVLTLCGCLEAAGIVGVSYCDEKTSRSGWVFMLPRERQETPEGATQITALKNALSRVDAWKLLENHARTVPNGFLALLDSMEG